MSFKNQPRKRKLTTTYHNYSTNNNKTKISIISLNTHGLNKNVPYLNETINKNQITFVQETMTNKINKLKSIIKNNHLYNFHFKEATKQQTNSRGRYSGGLAFIVDKNIESSCYFPTKRIGVLKTKNLAIIGVYMIYDNGENTAEFASDLAKIEQIYSTLIADKFETIITGDFNVDNYNQTPKVSNFLPIFKSFLGRNNLVTKDTEISPAVNYTFKGNNTQKWLDHVILNKNIIKNVDITILNDSNNRSDHLAINIILDYNGRTNYLGD